jgi:hypothetical protein
MCPHSSTVGSVPVYSIYPGTVTRDRSVRPTSSIAIDNECFKTSSGEQVEQTVGRDSRAVNLVLESGACVHTGVSSAPSACC